MWAFECYNYCTFKLLPRIFMRAFLSFSLLVGFFLSTPAFASLTLNIQNPNAVDAATICGKATTAFDNKGCASSGHTLTSIGNNHVCSITTNICTDRAPRIGCAAGSTAISVSVAGLSFTGCKLAQIPVNLNYSTQFSCSSWNGSVNTARVVTCYYYNVAGDKSLYIQLAGNLPNESVLFINLIGFHGQGTYLSDTNLTQISLRTNGQLPDATNNGCHNPNACTFTVGPTNITTAPQGTNTNVQVQIDCNKLCESGNNNIICSAPAAGTIVVPCISHDGP